MAKKGKQYSKIAGTWEEVKPSYTDLADVPSTFTPTSHTHGNITNGGEITASATIATGDHLVIADNSSGNDLTTSTITFDTTNTTTFLRKDGTWATPPAANGLNFVNTISLTTAKTGTDLYNAGLDGEGDYLIVNGGGDITNAGTPLITLAVQAPGDEGNSTPPVTLETGDWILFKSFDSQNNILEVILMNNNDATKAAAVHTHDDRYYTETESDNRFVNVTGDTMTGDLSITASDASDPYFIKLHNTSNASKVGIQFKDDTNGTQAGFLTFEHSDGASPGSTGTTFKFDDNSGYGPAVQIVDPDGGFFVGTNKVFHDGYHPNADTWTTARTLTIGNTGKSVNGSGNVSWSLAEIGALPLSGGAMSGSINMQSSDLKFEGSDPGDLVWYNGSGTEIHRLWSGTNTLNYRTNAGTTYGMFHDGYHPNADTLTTARTINGTSFNGSANITTANWGTARTLTIGNTGKSVNGSGNVSWSLAEIGAQAAGSYAAASHTHTLLTKLPDYTWSASTNARDYGEGLSVSFVQAANGFPSYGTVITAHTYANDGATLQLYTPYSDSYGGAGLKYRRGLYNNAGWTPFYKIWSEDNDGAGSGLDADTVDGLHASSFASSSHTHDDRYYTESEVNSLLAGKADSSHTHSYLPLSGGTLTGTLTSQQINMQNYDLTGVGTIYFNDPGVNEGVTWSNIKIFESPDALTNAAGNFQVATGSTRLFTVRTDGSVDVPGGPITSSGNISGTSGRLVMRDNSLENHFTNANSNVAINFVGYAGGTTQFRDLDIYDGKGNQISSFRGSDRAVLFPGLSLGISNTNSAPSGYGTYFRGNSSHFVFGLTNGNTLYLNYGNTSGAFRTYGTHYHNDVQIGTPWGSSNDGPSSGLSADDVDGYHAVAFVRNVYSEFLDDAFPAAPLTTSFTSWSKPTGMPSVTLEANSRYYVFAAGSYYTGATTTGIGISPTFSTVSGQIRGGQIWINTSTSTTAGTSEFTANWRTMSTSGGVTGNFALGTAGPTTIPGNEFGFYGIVETSGTSTVLSMHIRSEVNGSNVYVNRLALTAMKLPT